MRYKNRRYRVNYTLKGVKSTKIDNLLRQKPHTIIPVLIVPSAPIFPADFKKLLILIKLPLIIKTDHKNLMGANSPPQLIIFRVLVQVFLFIIFQKLKALIQQYAQQLKAKPEKSIK
jgi:hypothetical protein